jgi:hypothetical protein
MATAAQIEGKHFPQVHARSEPTCSQYAPRYTKQNPSLGHQATGLPPIADALGKRAGGLDRRWSDNLKWYDPRALIVVGLASAIGGFLLIDHYVGMFSIAGNAMRGKIFGVVPYRYVLLCSLCLISFGGYRFWTDKNKR